MSESIRLIDISKTFYLEGNRELSVIKNINLNINQGEMVSIIGKSGSGKSTLLHIMSGLVKPTKGTVLINGQNISQFNDDQISFFRNKQMGFVFQSFFLEPAFTAWENVALPLIVQNINLKERKKLAYSALECVGLQDRVNHKPNQMSGGEMQRVCIARAIINKPNIIFADEPTGNLDRENGENVFNILKGLVCQDTSVILVTHDEIDAAKCDRSIKLLDGAII